LDDYVESPDALHSFVGAMFSRKTGTHLFRTSLRELTLADKHIQGSLKPNVPKGETGRAGDSAAPRNQEFTMFSKLTISAAAAAVAVTALQAAPAEARHRDSRYENSNRGDYYGQGRYQRGDNYYGRNQGYYGQRSYNGRRCSGTTGTVIGGVAGALLGREVTRNSGRGFRRGNSGTTGAIIGGAIGALAGRAVAKSSCNNNRYYR
jgi:hypothetical protein